MTTSGGYNHPESYAYDPLGNITQKAGSVYTYGAGCPAGTRVAGPHAVCTVGGGSPFQYDGDGNLTKSGSRSVTYNPSNKVIHVESDPATSQGNDTGAADFMYGADGNRVVQSATSGGVTSRTVYVGLGPTGKSLYERTTTGTTTENVNFIYAGAAHGGGAFALRVLDQSGSVTANRYSSFDHLGSVTAMSDDRGRVSATGSDPTVLGYDVWGARRNPDETSANPASFNLPVGRRQFTGQEQIPDVGLVNMNGRLYDPSLGRFLSPDPNVQLAGDLQSYNRYSYAGNNPLRYTDPSGYFWSGIGNWFNNPQNGLHVWMAVGTLVACANYYACIVAGLIDVAIETGIAVANGAGFEQTITIAVVGIAVEVVSDGVASEFDGPLAAVIAGAASAAVTTGIANSMAGRSFFEWNVLTAAAVGAAEAGITLGLKQVSKVSQASAQTGSGSGEARMEAMHQFLEHGGFQLTDPTDPGVTGGPFALNDGSPMATLDDVPGCSSSPCAMPDVPDDYSVSFKPRLDPPIVSWPYPEGWAVGFTVSGVPTPIAGPGYGFSLQLFSTNTIALYVIDPQSSLAYGTPGLGVTADFSRGPGTAESWAGPFYQAEASVAWAQWSVFGAGTLDTGGWEGVSAGVGAGPPAGASVGTFNYKLIRSWSF